jgi:RNA polymerase sigma-70 factor (ECF subfamily)
MPKAIASGSGSNNTTSARIGTSGKPVSARLCLDPDSRAWIDALRSEGSVREGAARRLHALLFRAARFQLACRASEPQLRGEGIDDVATEAADDALVAILAHVDEFQGASRFTTWACKFAILEASTALRKRIWKGRELPVDPKGWRPLALSVSGPEEQVEQLELLHALPCAIEEVLTDRQRDVFVAIAVNGAPIDLVAARLGSTRGSIYKTLHDARQKLSTLLELSASAWQALLG